MAYLLFSAAHRFKGESSISGICLFSHSSSASGCLHRRSPCLRPQPTVPSSPSTVRSSLSPRPGQGARFCVPHFTAQNPPSHQPYNVYIYNNSGAMGEFTLFSSSGAKGDFTPLKVPYPSLQRSKPGGLKHYTIMPSLTPPLSPSLTPPLSPLFPLSYSTPLSPLCKSLNLGA